MAAFEIPEFPTRFNMARYFLDDRIEGGQGSRTAVLHRDSRLTYEEVHRGTNRVANVLTELGVEPEHRVLVVLPDRPEFVATFLAILRVGGVVTMANPLLPEEDYDYYLEYTRARAVVTHRDVLDRIAGPIARSRWLRSALVVDTSPEDLDRLAPEEARPRLRSFETMREAAPETFTTFDTHRDDPAIWLFTSGTTGKSKGAVHRHADFPFNTECYAKGVLGYEADDITIAVSKLFFGYATGTNLMFPFAVGATTALFEERSTAEQMHAMIARYRPTVMAAVPTTLRGMLQIEESQRADLSCLRRVVSAGEALPPELYKRFREEFDVEILDGIGSAEMFHIYVTNFPGDSRPGTLGRVVPGYTVELLDDDGRPVGDDEIGMMVVRGATAASGYWQDREKTVATFAGDRCRTGDKFRRDRDGYYFYCGRDDDLLKVGGIWVSPLEVEDCLLQHESVKEACVVGYEEDGLVKPLAFVVPSDEAQAGDETAETLRSYVREKLAKYKVPRRFVFLDALPRNDRGKIQRKLLRERAAENGS